MVRQLVFERKVGFNEVRNAVAAECRTGKGRMLTQAGNLAMDFTDNHAEVRKRLAATAEMLRAILSHEGIPFGEMPDLDAVIAKLQLEGSTLSAAEVMDLRRVAMMGGATLTWLRKNEVDMPTLSLEGADLYDFVPEISAIERVIDQHGEVRDSASPELREIRTRMRSLQGRANGVMRRIMANAVAEGILEAGATLSMRDGRLVIPVSAANKRRLPGIVHDESATGRTVFIEPAEVVEVSNRLREAQLEEQREIVRILSMLTDDLRPSAPMFDASFNVLGFMDFVHAKALYALRLGIGDETSGSPEINLSKGVELEWYHAEHPVLKLNLEAQGKEVVPLDITLSTKDRILVISGPNAGGKSVCLKTVGCLQYMVQTGLLPPVYSNSHFGIFKELMIDIGDDQSIDNDLSTYSSHLANMKSFLRYGNEHTLMLIDEFGSGTEPQIGGAIAAALLEEFNKRRMWGVVTTHYNDLKQMAENTPGLINGSMLYDRQKMEPLFKLLIGSPGSSFALEIARRMGLPREVIASARERVGDEYVNTDKYLLDIARDRKYWEQKRLEVKRREREVEQTLERYRTEAETLRKARRDILDAAKQEAQNIIAGSNAAIERTISEIRKAQAEKEETQRARQRLAEEKLRTSRQKTAQHPLLKKAPRGGHPAPKVQPDKDGALPLTVGSVVKLEGQTTPGKIMEINGDRATVAFGQLKTTVSLKRLRVTNAKLKNEDSRGASFVSAQTLEADRKRQLSFKDEIDVRGMRADEALQAVTYFLDDAIRFSVSKVRVLHGTGTGALRQAIRQFLKTFPGVEGFRDEDVRLGGAGITVINLG